MGWEGGERKWVRRHLWGGGRLVSCLFWCPRSLLLFFLLWCNHYLIQGDIIVRVNNVKVHSVTQVQKTINKTKHGRWATTEVRVISVHCTMPVLTFSVYKFFSQQILKVIFLADSETLVVYLYRRLLPLSPISPLASYWLSRDRRNTFPVTCSSLATPTEPHPPHKELPQARHHLLMCVHKRPIVTWYSYSGEKFFRIPNMLKLAMSPRALLM